MRKLLRASAVWLLSLSPIFGWAQADTLHYAHGEVVFSNFAQETHGFYLFEPADPTPDSAQVIVFLHGYGGYNPMIYGAWIRHLVRRGDIVIFPRYQKDIYFPRPGRFDDKAAQGIRDALDTLRTRPIVARTDRFTYLGHSYGAMTAATLAADSDRYGLPHPTAMLLSAPGTGPFFGLRRKSLRNLPEDLLLQIVVHDHDRTVGELMGRRIFETAERTPARNLIVQHEELRDSFGIRAGHNESYAIDLRYDMGHTNFTSRRARKIGRTDRMDLYGYWKLADALLDCDRRGLDCGLALGGTPEQRSLGVYENGLPVQPLEIIRPDDFEFPLRIRNLKTFQLEATDTLTRSTTQREQSEKQPATEQQ